VAADGFDPAAISAIVLTHAHADHAGGAAALSRLTGAKVLGLRETADYVSNGDTEAISLRSAIQAGIYPPDYRFEACAVDPVHDGETIAIGELSLRVVETPGHSSGHASFVLERDGRSLLFSGDLIFRGGHVSLQSTWDCRLDQYKSSVRRIAGMNIDSLFPGHLTFLFHDARSHIQAAIAEFDRLAIPKNIIGHS